MEKQFVVFNLGEEEFAVDINDVLEITKLKDITRIPNSEKHIIGVLNLRGRIHLIINLNKKLSLQEKPQDENTRVIIVENKKGRVGMVVDSVNQVLKMSDENSQNIPSSIEAKFNSHYLKRVLVEDKRMIILLDLANLLESEEEHIEKVNE